MKRDIKPYDPIYANLIADTVYASVHAIDTAIYTKLQQEAWCPTPIDYLKWSKRLLESKPWVAFDGDNLAGFIELEEKGYINCLYVHPTFQNRGIATQLYDYVLNIATAQRFTELTVDASIVAMPLFKKWGFEIQRTNTIERNNVYLINYRMIKAINP